MEFARRSSPARDRVSGDMATLFFSDSPRKSNGFNKGLEAVLLSVFMLYLLSFR
jgi:hypothetical protein